MRVKIHVGVTCAAQLHIVTAVSARFIGHEVQFVAHARHGIDLAAQLRDEEGGHHRIGSEIKAHRNFDGKGDFVDGGNILIRINEEPFPVQSYDLDLDGIG